MFSFLKFESMKTIISRVSFYTQLLSLSLTILVIVSGCNKDNDDSKSGGNGAATDIGSPTGSPVSGTFDASGGTLASQDGRVELIIPPGALASATTITLQPITNNIPLGIGDAYRLGPDGLEFSAPAKLVLHYREEEMTGTDPEAVFAAHQGADRIWLAHGGMSINTSDETITATLKHFSDWGFFASVFFDVSSEIVEPDEEVDLTLRFIPNAGSFSSMGEDDTEPVETPEAPEGEVDFEIDQSQQLPVDKGSISGSGSSGTFTAPSSFPQTGYNIVKLIGKYRLTPNQEYHLTQEVSLGGIVQFTVNGVTYFANSTCMATTIAGVSGLTGSSSVSPMGNVTINWEGTGVGTYISGGENSSSEFGASTEEVNYHSYYFVPCEDSIKYLTCAVNVTRANKEAMTMLGSFQGTVAYISGTKDCGGYITDNYMEAELIGYFKVRWTSLD